MRQSCIESSLKLHKNNSFHLKVHCRGADWVNKTIEKNRIRQVSVIPLYTEIHEDDKDLTAFIWPKGIKVW